MLVVCLLSVGVVCRLFGVPGVCCLCVLRCASCVFVFVVYCLWFVIMLIGRCWLFVVVRCRLLLFVVFYLCCVVACWVWFVFFVVVVRCVSLVVRCLV